MMESEDLYKELGTASSLLKRYFEDDLNAEERRELAAWLRVNRRNRDLLFRIRDGRNLKEHFERRRMLDVNEDFKELERRLEIARKKKKSPRILRMRYAVSAACLLLLCFGTWILWPSSGKQEEVLFAKNEKVSAVLTMANGTFVRIREHSEKGVVDGDYNFMVKDSAEGLVYRNGKTSSQEIRYHQLDVPRGGEYKLELEDGSVVWLNSESSVRFPEAFADSSREIEVSGEVFLEVTKDVSRPFIVKAGEYRTEVLGTSFMMRVYPDEQGWSTTLVDGKVKVNYRQSSLVLLPGKRAYVDGESLREADADFRYELAWMKGVFLFRHDRLENVMRTLSRWYDVDFVFENEELKDYEFTGSIHRDQSIDEALELFEKMNVVNFVKEKDYILIKKIDKVN